jgi:acyl-CoA dehydrogenase
MARMDFQPSPRARELHARLDAFMQRYLLPYNAAWQQAVQQGDYPPRFWRT